MITSTAFLAKQLEELEAGVLVLAGADHGARRGADLGQRVDVLGGDGLFQPHQAQVFDGLGQGDGRGQVKLAVAVDGQVDLVADRLAHALDQADDVASSLWRRRSSCRDQACPRRSGRRQT